ncbi:MAG: ABC transporter permease [Aristaeellaceae bacterium]
MIKKIQRHWFLFQELVKRDFMRKYNRTILGMGWSILSPLLQLLVMRIVFTQFFGRNVAHYTTYLFCGNLVFSYFKESTNGSLLSLLNNAHIFTKVNMPKYLFLLSKNVSSLINFCLTMVIFFLFAALDQITFTWNMLALIYPMLCLVVFNIGVGMILAVMYVFFRDLSYLYDIFTLMLTYLSAIFYTVDGFSPAIQNLFYLNPLYCYISYFRVIVLDGVLPSLSLHLLCMVYAVAALGLGALIYRKNNQKLLYYV